MQPELLIALGFAAVVGAGILITVGVVAWGGRRTLANLSRVGMRLGLEPVEKRTLGMLVGAELAGTLQGRSCRFWSFTTGTGKSQQMWCAVGVLARECGGLTFQLSRQGLSTKLMELFGSREITVGDPEFDKAWFVQTNEPEFLAAALVPEIRTRIMAAHRDGRGGWLRLERGEVSYAERGSFGSSERAERLAGKLPLLQDLADVAEVFGSSGKTKGAGSVADA